MSVMVFKSKEELLRSMEGLERIFDIVRVVNPIMTEVECLCDKGYGLKNSCYAVWNKDKRCDNCLSSRVMMTGHRGQKLEYMDKDIYFVLSHCIEVEGIRSVLELVIKLEDEYVEQLREYEHNIKNMTLLGMLVYQDELTGVYNRRYAEEKVGAMCEDAMRDNAPMMFALLDIDKLKVMNDSFGHSAGDMLIMTIASVAVQAIDQTKGSFMARIGGDEFLLVLNDMTFEKGRELLDNILKTVKNDCLDSCNGIAPSVSIGAAMLSELPRNDFKSMLELTDKRLYQAKYSGGGRAVYRD